MLPFLARPLDLVVGSLREVHILPDEEAKVAGVDVTQERLERICRTTWAVVVAEAHPLPRLGRVHVLHGDVLAGCADDDAWLEA